MLTIAPSLHSITFRFAALHFFTLFPRWWLLLVGLLRRAHERKKGVSFKEYALLLVMLEWSIIGLIERLELVRPVYMRCLGHDCCIIATWLYHYVSLV